MNKSYFMRLYDYHFWVHRKVWVWVLALTEEQYRHELEYSTGLARPRRFFGGYG